VWDAGCATGAEPYTLAMILRENMGQFLFRNVRILATDLNGQFREIIAKGQYPLEQVKRIPSGLFEKYFNPGDEPETFTLTESLRRSIKFQEHDLTSLQPIRSGFGLVVCKNVLLHLNPKQRVEVLRMFHEVLLEGGFLATEPTQKMPVEAQDWFRPVCSSGAVYKRV